MTDIVHTSHERDVVATDAIIRNARSGTFRNVAIGVGAAGALLLTGAAPLVWASKQGTDPDAMTEALKKMPPLSITVKVEGDVGVKDGGKVEIAEGGTVALEPGAKVTVRGTLKEEKAPQLPRTGPDNDPAIKTEVFVFKTVDHNQGVVETGWVFASGAAKAPTRQYCNYKTIDGSTMKLELLVRKGEDDPTARSKFVDFDEMKAKCVWFNGGI